MDEYPPEYDGPDQCEVCAGYIGATRREPRGDECRCPECPSCGESGDPKCAVNKNLAVYFWQAAGLAARRERMHCARFVTRVGVQSQCQYWAFHEGQCDDNPEPEKSSYAPG